MNLLRIVAVLALLAMAGFCTFGFLATYEPPAWPTLRVGYAITATACLAGVGILCVRPRRRR
jgi:hypothetical protein